MKGFLGKRMFLVLVGLFVLFSAASSLAPQQDKTPKSYVPVRGEGLEIPWFMRDFVLPFHDPLSRQSLGLNRMITSARVFNLLAAGAAGRVGIVTNVNDNTIHIIDPATNTISGPFLSGQLGSSQLLDAVITPDGKTGIVSNFGSQTIYFIDLSNQSSPTVLGSTAVGMYAEDLDVTPDGKFVLVSDGGYSASLASVNVTTRSLVQLFAMPSDYQAQAVSVAADGRTVLAADFDGYRVHVLLLDPATGTLAYGNVINFEINPINVSISPDGRTAIVVNTWGYNPEILRIDSPGNVSSVGNVTIPGDWGCSIAFSPDGKKAYYLAVSPGGETAELLNVVPLQGTYVYVLNVSGPGSVTYSGTAISVTPARSGIFYGVNEIAVEPAGKYAYVGNPVSSGPNSVAVIDLNSNTQIGSLTAGDVPVSIAFPAKAPEADIAVSKSVDNLTPYLDDTIHYTVTAINNGPDDSTGFELLDKLPDGLTYLSHTVTAGNYDPSTGIWTIWSLSRGRSAALTITAKVAKAGTITNTAKVRKADLRDSNAANDSASIAIEARPKPDFSNAQFNYEVTDKASARAGQTISFTIYFKNSGGQATGVVVLDTLSPNMESIQPLDGGVLSGSTITWSPGAVSANSGGSVRLTAKVKAGVPPGIKIFNNASIDSDQTIPVNTNTVVITVLY